MYIVNNSKLVSKSLVLLDKEYCGVLPNNAKLNFQNSPFFGVELVLVKRILRAIGSIDDEGTENSNDIRKKYSFDEDKFQVVNEYIPPKLNFIHKTDDDSDDLISKFTSEILKDIAEDKIGAIGINFVFELSKEKFNFTEIVSDNFKNSLDKISVKLSYPEKNYCLNITISNENTKSGNINISSNFHFQDLSKQTIPSILSEDLLCKIRSKLSDFSK